jgi:glycosyltransferase involved in cell wall biosynthesis
MSKTAAYILNHNLPDYTDMLYESLKPYEKHDYDLFVIDNGSSDKGKSKYTSFELGENVYFGGGFNAAMQHTLENGKYDSMLFLNNDLTIHPYDFVASLREELFEEVFLDKLGFQEEKYDIVSPSFYNVEANGQCHWKSMHSWNARETREVDYIDFQSPLISRRLLEEIKEIDPDLMYGWGICFYFALVAKKKNWKLGMVDRCCVLHHNSLTVKRGVAGLDIPTYCRRAEEGQYKFFAKTNLYNDYIALRAEAEKYTYPRTNQSGWKS